jgi:hypothetical protein
MSSLWFYKFLFVDRIIIWFLKLILVSWVLQIFISLNNVEWAPDETFFGLTWSAVLAAAKAPFLCINENWICRNGKNRAPFLTFVRNRFLNQDRHLEYKNHELHGENANCRIFLVTNFTNLSLCKRVSMYIFYKHYLFVVISIIIDFAFFGFPKFQPGSVERDILLTLIY